MEPRVALINGGARGIGRAIASALAQTGWSVAVSYKKSDSEAKDLEKELRAKGARVTTMQADVSRAPAAEALVQKVESECGRVDALVNCAGPYHRIHLLEESLEGWHAMFDNNLHSVFYLTRAVAAGMQRRGWGRIVNFSVANADQHVGQPYVTAYYISKAALLILTRSFAKVLAPDGITVNAISPGFIETESVPLEELAKLTKNIPAGYVGKPDDAASVVSYLLSEEARYVNGANIHLSGAWGV